MAGPNIRRLYYSASDVCRITGVGLGTLKGWEFKFNNLKPARSQTGRRLYKPSDIALVKRIKRLKDVGYTDEKVTEMLLVQHEHVIPPVLSEPVIEPAVNTSTSPEILTRLKQDLKEILDLLGDGTDVQGRNADEQGLL